MQWRRTLAPVNWAGCCIAVVPCWNEAATLPSLVTELQGRVRAVLVVDDGSTDTTAAVARAAGAVVLRHAARRGKGAALRTGLAAARERGGTWALLLDGDGQHAVADAGALFTCAETAGAALVVGNRMGGAQAMPWLRRSANRWLSRRLSERAGRELPDSQCGYRLVCLEAWSRLELTTSHFEIESEMLLAFLAQGARVAFAPVQCLPSPRPSRIQPVRDTLRWWRWWRQSRRRSVGPAVPAAILSLHSHE
jgi:glycosyltransferase involved in cell wall biosynthesis